MMKRLHFVTWMLIAINVIVFAFLSWKQQSVMFDTSSDMMALLRAGANFNPFTIGGEPWRLVSSMFLHGNIYHIAMNMVALFVIGRQLEEDEGPLKFVLIYFIVGIAAGIASLTFNVYVMSVGASGAIFGVFGYNVVREMFLRYRDRDALFSLAISFIAFVALNYAVAVFLSDGPLQMMLDTAAHIGGLAFGAILASLVSIIRLKREFILIASLILVSSAVLILPKHQLKYYNVFQKVAAAEDRQNRLVGVRLTDEQYADSLRLFIGDWQEVDSVLRDLEFVPEELRQDTSVVAYYVHWREALAKFKVLEIDNESYIYEDSIEIANQQLDSMPPLQHYLNFRAAAPRKPVIEEDSATVPVLVSHTVYYDSNWRETDPFNAVYYRQGQHDSEKRWQGKVRDYYADGRIQMKGAYLNSMDHGIFIYYSRDQKYESAGRYDHDELIGKWEYFYPNGKLHREIVYANRVFIRNVYDTAGNRQVNNGYGHEINYHSNGQVEEEGEIVDGWRQGLWKGYYPDGRPFFEEYYRNNKLMQGKSVDAKGNRYIYDHTSFFPYPVDGIEKYQRYLATNLRRPSLPMKEGVVRVNFTVDHDGALKDFVIVKSLCGECDAEAIRLIREGSKWRPALNRGSEKVSAKTSVDVFF